MSGKIGKDFKYNFKYTTTPPKGPDYEEIKAAMREDLDVFREVEKGVWQQYNPINPVASSVSAARWTNKLLRDATWIKPRQTASALVAEYRKLVADFPQLLEL